MSVLHVNEKQFSTRPDGRLERLSDWNEDVAEAIAAKENLVLTPAHWKVIHAIRSFYQEYNITPLRKLLKKTLAENYGADQASDDYLAGLFPDDVMHQGTRIAGVPEPLLDAQLEHGRNMRTVSDSAKATHFFQAFEFEGEVYKVYPQGNLMEPDTWSRELAQFMARREGIDLTPAHWEVLDFMRKFYFEYGITPMVRLLIKHMGAALGEEKANRELLYQLFPGGPSRQGSRIAGLPEPQGCIDT